MIITCINCNKKFDIDSSLIPDKGRLLQCAGCDHKWFFKNSINPIKDNNNDISFLDQNKSTNNAEISSSDQLMEKIEAFSEEDLEEKIEIDREEEVKKKTLVNINNEISAKSKPRNQKKFKVLNVFIVVVISFVAFIIIIDTFKYPIGKVVPSVEFILYNLYESIKDISLFIRDLT
jgi:predicted Zn finger-like uncharacterized protein